MSESTESSQSSVHSENARRPTRRAKEAARQKVAKLTDDDNDSQAKSQPKAPQSGKQKELPSRPRARIVQPIEELEENEENVAGESNGNLHQIFIDVQHSVHSHEKLAERFKTLLQKTGPLKFWPEMEYLLRQVLLVPEREPHADRVIEFIALAVAKSGDDRFMEHVLTYLSSSKVHDHPQRAIRFRAVQLMERVLQRMPECAQLNEEVFAKIQDALLVRRQDKVPTVRAEAVRSLIRLQDPNNSDSCPVSRALLKSLESDSAPEVRKASLQTVVLNQRTLNEVLQRTRDVSDTVRKTAYDILALKCHIRSIQLAKRVRILTDLVHDKSTIVHESGRKLIQAWIKRLNGDLHLFLKSIDVENNMQLAEDVFNMILEDVVRDKDRLDQLISTLVEQFDVERHELNIEKLDCEWSFLWRMIIVFLSKRIAEQRNKKEEGVELDEFLGQTHEQEVLEQLLPVNVIHFSEYIHGVCNSLLEVVAECEAARSETDADQPVSFMPTDEANLEKYARLQHVLVQLVLICEHMDLSDEAGRGHLKKLLYRILAQPSILNDLLITNTLRILRRLEGRDNRLVERVAEIIAELRSPSLSSSPTGRLSPVARLALDMDIEPIAPAPSASEAPASSAADGINAQSNPEDVVPPADIDMQLPTNPEEPAAQGATANAATANDGGAAGEANDVAVPVPLAVNVFLSDAAGAPSAADPELSPRTKLKQKKYEIHIASIKVKIHERRMALEAAVQVQDFELAAKLKGELGVLEVQKQEFSDAMHEHLLSARAQYEKQQREAATAAAAAAAASAAAEEAAAEAAEAIAAELQQQAAQQQQQQVTATEPMCAAEGAAAAAPVTASNSGSGPEEVGERNDPRTLVSVLRILRGLLEVLPTLELGHVLRSLHDSLVLPSVQHNHPEVRRIAVTCLGMCCLVDRELAIRHFFLLVQVCRLDQPIVKLNALQCLFDLLLVFGVEVFGQKESALDAPQRKNRHRERDHRTVQRTASTDSRPGSANSRLLYSPSGDEELSDECDEDISDKRRDSDDSDESSSERDHQVLGFLADFLGSEHTEFRNLAAEGLSKLLYIDRIASSRLISRLLLLWYNPLTNENAFLKNFLGQFLMAYAIRDAGHQLQIADAFLPSLRAVMHAPRGSPLSDIDAFNLLSLFLQLTNSKRLFRPPANMHNPQHDRIAGLVFDELKAKPTGVFVEFWTRALLQLEISPQNKELQRELLDTSEHLISRVKDKQPQRNLHKFCETLRDQLRENGVCVEDPRPLSRVSSTISLDRASSRASVESEATQQGLFAAPSSRRRNLTTRTNDTLLDQVDEDDDLESIREGRLRLFSGSECAPTDEELSVAGDDQDDDSTASGSVTAQSAEINATLRHINATINDYPFGPIPQFNNLTIDESISNSSMREARAKKQQTAATTTRQTVVQAEIADNSFNTSTTGARKGRGRPPKGPPTNRKQQRKGNDEPDAELNESESESEKSSIASGSRDRRRKSARRTAQQQTAAVRHQNSSSRESSPARHDTSLNTSAYNLRERLNSSHASADTSSSSDVNRSMRSAAAASGGNRRGSPARRGGAQQQDISSSHRRDPSGRSSARLLNTSLHSKHH